MEPAGDSGLDVVNHDTHEVPRPGVREAAVVVPDSQVAEVTQWILGGHEERIQSTFTEHGPVAVAEAADICLVVITCDGGG